MEGTLAEIRMYAGNVTPSGWEYCHGQLLPIAGNAALFSLLETTFGGDGMADFGLPDFRGRTAVGVGDGPGLSNRPIGESEGTEATTLQIANLPAHNHAITGSVTPQASADGSLGDDATGRNWGPGYFYSAPKDLLSMAPISSAGLSVGTTGSGDEFSLMQPYLAVHYIICVRGPYPSLL